MTNELAMGGLKYLLTTEYLTAELFNLLDHCFSKHVQKKQIIGHDSIMCPFPGHEYSKSKHALKSRKIVHVFKTCTETVHEL